MNKIVWQALIILTASALLGLTVHFSLVRDYIKGEFQHHFLRSEEFPHVVFIPLGEAEALFVEGEALFIDSRSERDYKTGHIFGAINISFGEKKAEKFEALEQVSFDRVLVIYCDGSECRSSTELARALDLRGFRNIKVFFGGWKEWQREGLPVSSENDPE
jgi:rhodanese-related sulfurtransferase